MPISRFRPKSKMNLKNFKLQQRHKYLLEALFIVVSLFLFSYADGSWKIGSFILTVLVAILGSIWVQFTSVTTPSDKFKKFFSNTVLQVITLPATLTLGALLALIYFPNLGIPTKTLAILGIGFFMYVALLVGNILLVVYEKDEVIPLYRVAATWSQILVVVVSIPLYAGIFKLPILPFFQCALVGFSAVIFALYLTWSQEMDPEIPPINRGEQFVTSLFVGFLVGSLGLSISFLPTESFLRALLLSSVLMFSLGYIQAHYKNVVTKKLIFEYSLISILFLIFVLIFNQV